MTAAIEKVIATGKTWHGQHEQLDALVTIGTAMERAGLRFEVRREALFTADGKQATIYAHVRDRDGRHLGYASASYALFQPAEMADFASAIARQGGLPADSVTSAGSFRGGREIALSLSLPSGFSTPILADGRREQLETTLSIGNSYDRSSALFVALGGRRIVCHNTYRMAVEGAQLRIAHDGYLAEKVDRAMALLERAPEYGSEMARRAVLLANRPMGARELDEVMGRAALADVLGDTSVLRAAGSIREIAGDTLLTEMIAAREAVRSTTLDDLIDARMGGCASRKERFLRTSREMVRLAHQGAGNNGSTAWDAWNGVTDYVDHARPFRRSRTESADEQRATFGTVGAGAKLKSELLEVLVERSSH